MPTNDQKGTVMPTESPSLSDQALPRVVEWLESQGMRSDQIHVDREDLGWGQGWSHQIICEERPDEWAFWIAYEENGSRYLQGAYAEPYNSFILSFYEEA